MKKFLYVIVLAGMMIPSLVFAQVKSYVGVVRQQYYSEYIDFFKAMSKELKDDGYNTYSKAVDNYLDGGFGSGFVWVAADGTNYVITNRHVVAQAQTASVEFEDEETGEITKYEGLKVVATDDDIDIAILAFKDGERPFKKGLKLSEAALKDGQEVWSAGYPGLGNEPVWQFGKGTVTNARARLKDLLDPEVSTIIQHSAQIDGGNSGGPLLIASGKEYVVVGINTWKAAYRDSTNFAIPASVINKMIQGVAQETTSAQDRAVKLAKLLGDSTQTYTSVVNFISYHKASVDGSDAFDSVLKFAPTAVRSYVSEAFSYNPAEGLRYACAYQLFKKYGSTDSKTYSYKSEVTEETDDKVIISFISGEGEEAQSFKTTWIKEHGLWRLDANAKEEEAKSDGKAKKKSSKAAGSSSSSPIRFAGIDGLDTAQFKLGYELPLSEQGKTFGGEFIFFMDAQLIGVTIGAYKLDNGVNNLFGAQMGGVVRLPIDFDLFTVSPYIEAGPSMAIFGKFNPLLNFFYEAGVCIAFDTSSTVYPGFGVAYKGRKYIKFMEDTYEGVRDCVQIFVTIGF